MPFKAVVPVEDLIPTGGKKQIEILEQGKDTPAYICLWCGRVEQTCQCFPMHGQWTMVYRNGLPVGWFLLDGDTLK